MKVRLKNVRLGFAHQLHVPSSMEEGKPLKYGCDAILVEGSSVESFAAEKNAWVKTTMPAVLEAVANEAMKGKGKPWLDSLEASKRCYRDGSKRVDRSGDPYEGYEGVWYVAAKNTARPLLLDRDGKTPLTQDDGKPYSGCYAHVVIDVYALTDAKRKGAHATIKTVMFVKDGDQFGGGGSGTEDDVADLAVVDSADDLA